MPATCEATERQRPAPGALSANCAPNAHFAKEAKSAPVRHVARHRAMGTIFSLILYGDQLPRLEHAARRCFAEVDRLTAMMSHYNPQSELSGINREAGRCEVAVSGEMFELLARALDLSAQTNGLFDITVGPLMKSWGFFRKYGRVPSDDELRATKQRVGWRHVALNAAGRTVGFDLQGVELNLGAIGKGYAVDRIAEELRRTGITRALISCGESSIYAMGAGPEGKGWRIQVRHPGDRMRVLASFWLNDMAVSVSGDAEQAFVEDGRLYSHIMEPSTGIARGGGILSIAIARSAERSDACSTAFYVGGTEAAGNFVERNPDVAAIVCSVQSGAATGAGREMRAEVLRSPAGNLPVINLFPPSPGEAGTFCGTDRG